MNVIYGIGQAKRVPAKTVLAVGVFDGLHIGHQKLIKEAVKHARAKGAESIVMTFSPHPVRVLYPQRYLPFIVSLEHRLQLIAELGVSACMVVRFTKQFSRLTAEHFIERYIWQAFHPDAVFVGEDFRFGLRRQGTVQQLKSAGEEYGFSVYAEVPVNHQGSKIGSSRIRSLIQEGQLNLAKRLLGREVSILGQVVRGDGRGARLGFPTINIVPEDIVTPPPGVYAARVMVHGKKWDAMANIGYRPSFYPSKARLIIEAHVFRFKKNLYGQFVTIEFLKKIRAEQKFFSPDHLMSQLRHDQLSAQLILQR